MVLPFLLDARSVQSNAQHPESKLGAYQHSCMVDCLVNRGRGRNLSSMLRPILQYCATVIRVMSGREGNDLHLLVRVV